MSARLSALSALSLACLALQGCLLAAVAVGAAAGYGIYKYENGVATVEYDKPLGKCVESSVKVVEEVGWTLESKTQDAYSGKIKARRPDNSSVEIRFERIGEKGTRVSIRVGTFGDEKISRDFHDRLKARL